LREYKHKGKEVRIQESALNQEGNKKVKLQTSNPKVQISKTLFHHKDVKYAEIKNKNRQMILEASLS